MYKNTLIYQIFLIFKALKGFISNYDQNPYCDQAYYYPNYYNNHNNYNKGFFDQDRIVECLIQNFKEKICCCCDSICSLTKKIPEDLSAVTTLCVNSNKNVLISEMDSLETEINIALQKRNVRTTAEIKVLIENFKLSFNQMLLLATSTGAINVDSALLFLVNPDAAMMPGAEPTPPEIPNTSAITLFLTKINNVIDTLENQILSAVESGFKSGSSTAAKVGESTLDAIDTTFNNLLNELLAVFAGSVKAPMEAVMEEMMNMDEMMEAEVKVPLDPKKILEPLMVLEGMMAA